MFQRSGDLVVGVPSNMIQYSALAMMLASMTGYNPGFYYHTISDAHIYEDQLPAVEEMLCRDARPLPTASLTDEGAKVSDISQMRGRHFRLHGYNPHPPIKGIPVAV
jgi:thymidylate synthase